MLLHHVVGKELATCTDCQIKNYNIHDTEFFKCISFNGTRDGAYV